MTDISQAKDQLNQRRGFFACYLLEASKHSEYTYRETKSQHVIDQQSQKQLLLELALNLRSSCPPVLYSQSSCLLWTA